MNLPEFGGENSGDDFMDWILQDEVAFEYKDSGDPNVLAETKHKKGAIALVA